MAGILSISKDHIVGGTSILFNYNEFFVSVYNFLNTKYTRIASNYGVAAGGLDGAGFGYHDAGSGHSAAQSFAVFRTNGNALPPYNIVLFWTNLLHPNWTFDSAGGNGPRCSIGAAIRDDGTDAWNGTTNNDGTDTVGTPRWTVGGASTLFTFNHFNEPGGARATNKDDLMTIGHNQLGITNRDLLFHMWADDDTFLLVSEAEAGKLWLTYIGEYELINGNTHDDGMPCVGMLEQNARWISTAGELGPYGATTQEGGGLLPPRGGGGAPQYHVDTLPALAANSAFQPNPQLDIPSYVISKHAIVNRQGDPEDFGHVGAFPSWMLFGIDIPCNSVLPGPPFYAAFGANITSNRGVLAWDNTTPGRADASRTGTQFDWTG
jgi:hypothetical protein